MNEWLENTFYTSTVTYEYIVAVDHLVDTLFVQELVLTDFSANRSNDAADYDFDVLNVLRWIQVLQEMYNDFDYNDLECQKKIICEVMQEPEYYGAAAQKFKTGFR